MTATVEIFTKEGEDLIEEKVWISTSITAAGDKVVSGARAGNGLNIDSGLVRIIG